MSIAILFLLLLVGFGAVVVWTLRAVPTPDDGEPEPAAAPTIRAVLRFAGERIQELAAVGGCETAGQRFTDTACRGQGVCRQGIGPAR